MSKKEWFLMLEYVCIYNCRRREGSPCIQHTQTKWSFYHLGQWQQVLASSSAKRGSFPPSLSHYTHKHTNPGFNIHLVFIWFEYFVRSWNPKIVNSKFFIVYVKKLNLMLMKFKLSVWTYYFVFFKTTKTRTKRAHRHFICVIVLPNFINIHCLFKIFMN